MGYFDDMFSSSQNIMDVVNKAVKTNNYRNLNKNISIQVIDLNKELQKYIDNRRREVIYYNQNPYAVPRPANPGMYQQQIYQAKGTPFQRVTPRYSNAIFKIIFGIFGFTVIVPMLFGILGFSAFTGLGSTALSLFMLIAGLAVCAFLIKNGSSQKRLLDKFYKYSRLCGSEDYISIAKLAKVAGESEVSVVQALEQMIKAGYLPYAKMDAEKRTLMLSEEVYKEYLDKINEKVAKEQVEKEKKAGIENLEVSEEVKKTILEGQSFIQYVKESNDRIPDAEMTGKLSKMEFIVNRIFDQVKKDPSSAEDLNRLMTYYLPTTRKLIDAYIDLDKQAMSSKNIEETKTEINGAMDTINEAFATLFDGMFRDVAWDISSEVSAMKTMMAQDGLADPVHNNMHDSLAKDSKEMIEEMNKQASLENTVSEVENDGNDTYTPELTIDVETEDGTVRQTH